MTVDVATFGRPCLGEERSGDAAVVVERDGRVFVALLDVLGHGDEAHRVARRAAALLEERPAEELPATLRRLHEALRGEPRGAAVAVGELDLATGALRYAAVGNVGARTLEPGGPSLGSQEGVVGGVLPGLRVQQVTLGAGDVLLLFTDGVKSGFAPEGLRGAGAATLARRVVHRHGKPHDDATCVALRVVA